MWQLLAFFSSLVVTSYSGVAYSPTHNFRSLGCWYNQKVGRTRIVIPAISTLENQTAYTKDKYWERFDPISQCAQAASSLGHTVFAVSNGGYSRGGECYSSCDAALEFAKFGRATNCAASGTGGWKKMNVYSLDDISYLGCSKNPPVPRNALEQYVIPDMEGTHPALFGQPRAREHAINICSAVARRRGYNVFAITEGGRCLGSGDAYHLYNKHGPSRECIPHENGSKGGKYAMAVYFITGITKVEPAQDISIQVLQRKKHFGYRRRINKKRRQ